MLSNCMEVLMKCLYTYYFMSPTCSQVGLKMSPITYNKEYPILPVHGESVTFHSLIHSDLHRQSLSLYKSSLLHKNQYSLQYLLFS